MNRDLARISLLMENTEMNKDTSDQNTKNIKPIEFQSAYFL